MSDDTHDGREDGKILTVRPRNEELINDKRREPHRRESFECIGQEDGVSPFFSQHAKYVCRADVSTAGCTDIGACDPAGKVSER